MGSIVNASDVLWCINKGFSVFWLFIMYYLGAFLRKFEIGKNFKKSKAACIYIACCIMTWAIAVILSLKAGDEAVDKAFNYASPPVVCSAVLLLILFMNLNIRKDSVEKILRKISTTAFSVYIVHYDKAIWSWISNAISIFDNIYAPLVVILVSLMIVAVCSFVDVLRNRLFAYMGIPKLCSKIQVLYDNAISIIESRFTV